MKPMNQTRRHKNEYKTPEKQTKKTRRRNDGSPRLPLNLALPSKTVYLIRHGQSQGQVAKRNGLDRQCDTRLRDCGLTPKGESQALALRNILGGDNQTPVELVLSSPLTRAFHTALLGFPLKDILVHYDLREVGSKVPENTPRAMDAVLKELEYILCDRDPSRSVDVTSLQPSDWPRDYSPNVIKKERIRKLFQWLYREREETAIAVVCHYNVIRSAVIEGEKLRPRNAEPIFCKLYPNGELIVGSGISAG